MTAGLGYPGQRLVPRCLGCNKDWSCTWRRCLELQPGRFEHVECSSRAGQARADIRALWHHSGHAPSAISTARWLQHKQYHYFLITCCADLSEGSISILKTRSLTRLFKDRWSTTSIACLPSSLKITLTSTMFWHAIVFLVCAVDCVFDCVVTIRMWFSTILHRIQDNGFTNYKALGCEPGSLHVSY